MRGPSWERYHIAEAREARRLAALPQPSPQAEKPPAPVINRLSFCHHPLCGRGAPRLRATVNQEAERRGLTLDIETTTTLCPGTCKEGPFVGLPQKGLFLHGVAEADATRLVEETILHGRMLFDRLRILPTVVYDSRVLFDRQQKVMVLLGTEICPVDAAAYLFFLNAAESCGKCSPCRVGVPLVARILRGYLTGQAGPDDLSRLKDLVNTLSETTYCLFAAKVAAPLEVALMGLSYQFDRHRAAPCKGHPLTGLAPGPEAARGGKA